MAVDEAGHDDLVRSIDNLGVGHLQSGADVDDLAASNKHIALSQIPNGPVHRQNMSAPDEERTT